MTLPQFKGVEVHPAANIFPLMDDAAFADLVADIRENGQRESCSLYKGQLIDGRNRWLACQEIGIEPEVGEFEDDDFDVVKFVLSANLHRRHLTESQRAMVAVRVMEVLKPAAKERQSATQIKNGKSPVKENLPSPSNGQSRDKAGAMLNVSGKTVDHARTVIEQGSKELIAKVESGEVSVSKAAKVAKAHDKRSQVAALSDPPKAKPERNVFTELRKVFDSMTDAERKQALVMWDEWLQA